MILECGTQNSFDHSDTSATREDKLELAWMISRIYIFPFFKHLFLELFVCKLNAILWHVEISFKNCIIFALIDYFLSYTQSKY